MKKAHGIAALISLIPLVAYAPPAPQPPWWTEPGTNIIAPPGTPINNYAPVNLGQLKNVATQAWAHLEEALAPIGGAGFPKPTWGSPATENYLPANIGQLKAVALPFYDRLIEVGFATTQNLIDRGYPSNWSSAYPWLSNTPKEQNYAVANIGQLKMVFSFDLRIDTDNDAMPNWWEAKYGFDSNQAADASADADGDGLTNSAELSRGTNPRNSDSDADGESDQEDAEPLRREEIPVKQYVLVDLEAQLSTPWINRSAPVLDDAHRVALWGYRDVDPPHWGQPDRKLRIAVWENGQMTEKQSTATGVTLRLPNSATDTWHQKDYQPAGISGFGYVAGRFIENASRPDPPEYNSFGWYYGQFTSASDPMSPAALILHESPSSRPTEAIYQYPPTYLHVSRRGAVFGLEPTYVPNGVPVSFTPFFDPHRFTQFQAGGENAIFIASSDGNKLIWGRNESGSTTAYLWDPPVGNQALALPVWDIYGLNDQKHIIGKDIYESPGQQYPDGTGGFRAGRGWLGYVWENNQKKILHDLLPETFRKRVRSALPYRIGNVNAATGWRQITFWAETLELNGMQTEWLIRAFVLETEPGKDPVMRRVVIPSATSPWHVNNLIQQNASGSYAALITGRLSLLLPVEIKEVISDQISGSECNKLPTAFYNGDGAPNNPMLMATRTGQSAHLAVKMDVPAAFASKIHVGVRKIGATTILGSAASIALPGKTLLQFPALPGHKMYEVIAGYDTNVNHILDNAEANIAFEKTPRKNASGAVVAANLNHLDKIIVVEQGQFVSSKNYLTTGGNWPSTDYAGDLIDAFANGVGSVPTAIKTSPVKLSATHPDLSHPVGAKWDANCEDDTYRFTFPDGVEAADDFEDSKALQSIIDEVIQDNIASLLSSGSGQPGWPVSRLPDFRKFRDFSITDKATVGFNELNVAFGRVWIEGTLEVSFRVTSPTTLEVGSVKVLGKFDDLYDFNYWPIGAAASSAAMVQAGHASLSTAANPSGKVFWTRLEYNVDWKPLGKTFTQ